MGPARSKGTGEEHGNSIKKTIGFRHYENVFKIKTLSARAQTECPVANEREDGTFVLIPQLRKKLGRVE